MSRSSHVQTHMDALNLTRLNSEKRRQRHHVDFTQSNHFLCRGLGAHIGGGFVHVCLCLYVRVCGFQNKVGGRFWASCAVIFHFQGSSRKADKQVPLFFSFFLFHNLPIYQRARSREMGVPQPKVSSIDTHTRTSLAACVFPSVCRHQ